MAQLLVFTRKQFDQALADKDEEIRRLHSLLAQASEDTTVLRFERETWKRQAQTYLTEIGALRTELDSYWGNQRKPDQVR